MKPRLNLGSVDFKIHDPLEKIALEADKSRIPRIHGGIRLEMLKCPADSFSHMSFGRESAHEFKASGSKAPEQDFDAGQVYIGWMR